MAVLSRLGLKSASRSTISVRLSNAAGQLAVLPRDVCALDQNADSRLDSIAQPRHVEQSDYMYRKLQEYRKNDIGVEDVAQWPLFRQFVYRLRSQAKVSAPPVMERYVIHVPGPGKCRESTI